MALNARWGGGVNFLTQCTPTYDKNRPDSRDIVPYLANFKLLLVSCIQAALFLVFAVNLCVPYQVYQVP